VPLRRAWELLRTFSQFDPVLNITPPVADRTVAASSQNNRPDARLLEPPANRGPVCIEPLCQGVGAGEPLRFINPMLLCDGCLRHAFPLTGGRRDHSPKPHYSRIIPPNPRPILRHQARRIEQRGFGSGGSQFAKHYSFSPGRSASLEPRVPKCLQYKRIGWCPRWSR
jgi:hypothetical protein